MMKYTLLLLSCLAAYVTSDCPEGSQHTDYSADKCSFDLVFRGIAVSGGSGFSQDGPETWFTHRYDMFAIHHVYKGSLTTEDTVFVTMTKSSSSTCPPTPYGDGGSQKLVFALQNTTTGVYYVLPCSDNPAYDCINQDAFEAVDCPVAGAAA